MSNFFSCFSLLSFRFCWNCEHENWVFVCVFVYEYVVVDSQLVLDCHTLAVSHCGSYHKNLLLFTYPFPAPNVLCIRTRVFLVCFYILVSCSSFPFDGWFLAKYLRFSEQQHYVYKCAFFFLFLSLFIESVVSSDIAYQNQPKIYVRISVSPFWLIHSMSS